MEHYFTELLDGSTQLLFDLAKLNVAGSGMAK